MINVFLVDDHELVRTGIRRLLEDAKGIKVLGEADCGESAVKKCRELMPDVVLMDMNMPGIGGLEATKKILRFNPDTHVIILTMHTEDPFPAQVMKAGASGFLTKDAGAKEVLNAIHAVNSGQRYLSSDVAQQMALNQFKADESPLSALSERELQIMLMITKGQKVTDISEQLNLSPKTVNAYRYRLFTKLGAVNDVELTHMAFRYGLLDNEKF